MAAGTPGKKIGARALVLVSFAQQVAAGSLLTTNALFCNPLSIGETYDVIGVEVSFDVVSTSGTMDLRRVPVSTAYTAGDSLLTGTFSLASGARAATRLTTLATAAASRLLRPGDALSLIFAGTMTGLAAFNLSVWLQPLAGKKLR